MPETSKGTCEVDVTYQTGTVDKFREVTEYSNDGVRLSFKGKKEAADGTLGPLSEWWIPIAGNVQSVAKRTVEDPNG